VKSTINSTNTLYETARNTVRQAVKAAGSTMEAHAERRIED
jgi:hypothetical protein